MTGLSFAFGRLVIFNYWRDATSIDYFVRPLKQLVRQAQNKQNKAIIELINEFKICLLCGGKTGQKKQKTLSEGNGPV